MTSNNNQRGGCRIKEGQCVKLLGANTMVPAIRPEPGCEMGKYGGRLLDTELLEKVITVMMPSVGFFFFLALKKKKRKRKTRCKEVKELVQELDAETHERCHYPSICQPQASHPSPCFSIRLLMTVW